MGDYEEADAWSAEYDRLVKAGVGLVQAAWAAQEIWQKVYAERTAKWFEAVS